MKKLTPVKPLVERVNAYLEASPDADVHERALLCGFLDIALEGAYLPTDHGKGFEYLPSEYDMYGKLRDYYDDTRRVYKIPKR